MKKLLFIPFFLGIVIGFNSCITESGSRIYTYLFSPAVIYYEIDRGGIVMGTPDGYFAVPSLTDVFEGDCIYVNAYTVNLDDQPSNDYFTAINIEKENVERSDLEYTDSLELGDYTLSITGAGAVISEFFNGIVFTAVSCKDKNPALRLIYNTEEPDKNGIKNFYLLARPSSANSDFEDVSTIYAFDMYNLIYTQGRDTTIFFEKNSEPSKPEPPSKYRYIRANLNYFSKLSDADEPEFKTVNKPNIPYIIYIYKNN